MEKFDLVVIGSGPAGRRAAIQAAKLGRSVLVVENRLRLGGVSVHTGTIPSKTLRETVLNLSGWRERGFYGMSYRVKKEIDGKDLTARLRKTLDYEIEVLEHQFARNGVRTFGGIARFADEHTIVVTDHDGEDHRYGFDFAVIAVGTAPYRPANIEFDHHTIVDSDAMVSEIRVPRSLTVVGAGVIGIEYATIFSALDVPVTIVEPRENFLDFIDREIIEEFTHDLRQRGVAMRLGSPVTKVEKDNMGQAVATLGDGRQVRSDMLLYAAGRVGATADLGLESCGVVPDSRGRLAVNPDTLQTQVPHIYAAGDVIGFPALASTSMEQGRLAALHAFKAQVPKKQESFPYGIYAVPEISTVGLTEAQVREQKIPYECGIARFRETSRGHIMGLQSGMMKLIVSLENRKLLGVHIVGEGATELIHIGQAVINLGAPLDYLVEATFNYPTLAEAYKIAALDAWNRMPQVVPVAPVADKATPTPEANPDNAN
ncbi:MULTISPECIES: Si-specific NAD(P)(+) transhydrogenase [unclassified Devosia]|uniref:Si-specific NAD(P)(+) transhydrogenase n=1 Tax=unclassified Devosia TaxID=196773 RepID=UPI00145D78EB|nr:Si-specific NAD(P)(+) transhydrogenase [Devosia sp. MC521]MBJ6988770.1 Si-specific NAD(P)(+) transhydrogenase [Devosia sp. MC521]MBK1796249.1 Si-specific NAD(P)(+) transhydrogenase [Devosia sp. WQ 349K1]QMW63095.1 Si-specific NAD(P)(+) transhydrogenase [Devosia sp. MC521]